MNLLLSIIGSIAVVVLAAKFIGFIASLSFPVLLMIIWFVFYFDRG